MLFLALLKGPLTASETNQLLRNLRAPGAPHICATFSTTVNGPPIMLVVLAAERLAPLTLKGSLFSTPPTSLSVCYFSSLWGPSRVLTQFSVPSLPFASNQSKDALKCSCP